MSRISTARRLFVLVATCLALVPASAAARTSRQMKVTYEASGMLNNDATMGPCDTSSDQAYCNYGDASSDFTFNHWRAVFDPVSVAGAGGSSSAPVGAQFLDWGDHTISDYHDGGNGNHHADCRLSSYAVDPAGPPLILTATDTGADIRLEAEAPYKPTITDPSGIACYVNNGAYSFPDPDLRTLLKAVATIPYSQLEQQSFQVNVSSADPGVTKPDPDCTAAAQADNSEDVASCSRQLSWSGVLNIEMVCPASISAGTVTFSDGAAPAKGTTFCVGDHVKTGKKGRVELTLEDGSVLRVGPESEAVLDEAEFKDDQRKFSAKLILGEIWAKVNSALGGDNKFEVTTERAGTGVRGRIVATASGGSLGGGGSFTISTQPNGNVLSHAISGKGYAQIPGKPQFGYLPGQGALISSTGARLTLDWPAADLALVPPAERPPAITHLLVSGAPAQTARVFFKLNRNAGAVVRVLKGKHVVATKSVKGAKGQNTVRPLKSRLSKGSYTVEVTATDSGKRVSIAEQKLSVK